MAEAQRQSWRPMEWFDMNMAGDLQAIEKAVKKHKVDLKAYFPEAPRRLYFDYRPIHLASAEGHPGVLEYLIRKGCDVNSLTGTLQRTPLHLSVINECTECSQLLLAAGAKPDVKDAVGNTPCHYAAVNDDADIVGVLADLGADLNAQDKSQSTVLMKSVRQRNLETTRALLAKGARTDLTDPHFGTALHFAAHIPDPDITQALLEAGCEVNAKDDRGETPFMISLFQNNRKVCELLSTKPIDTSTLFSTSNESVLHLAVRKNFSKVVENIIAQDPELQYRYNPQGELPLYQALVDDNQEMVAVFLRRNFDLDVAIKSYKSGFGKKASKVALDIGSEWLCGLLGSLGYMVGDMCDRRELARPGELSSTNVENWDRVCPLMGFARKVIRRQLGYRLSGDVTKLPVPTSLLAFIQLDDLNV